MTRFLKNLYNEIDFFFRSHIRFSRKYKGENESKENLFEYLPEENRLRIKEKEALYFEKYCLHKLKDNSTKRNYLENLGVIELLETCINVEKNNIKILDIGSKNWFYVFGEYSFFKYNNFEKEICIDGIEIDAFRIYTDFHSRHDYALYYSEGLENCRYIAGDFLKHQSKYDYIIWFFPFVAEYSLLKWGLPLGTFKPLEMLRHAVDSLNPGGSILIVNQDENEYSVQESLIKKLNVSYKKQGSFKNSFLEYKHKRYVTVINADLG